MIPGSFDKALYLAKAAARRARWWPTDLISRRGSNQLDPRRSLSFVGRGDFHSAGEEYLDHFRTFGGLTATDDVLDMGCGIGRMALPLLGYLADGSYEGFDVSKPMIRWCQRHISAQRPNFNFRWVPVHNRKYNPFGDTPDTAFRFPYADSSFDFSFATSLFTHMSHEAIEHYIREMARVLRPGGRCLLTFFILTDDTKRAMTEGRAAFDFAHPAGGGFTTDPRQPEYGMAFELEVLTNIFRSANLEIEAPIHYGQWGGNPTGLAGQDVVVASLSEEQLDITRKLDRPATARSEVDAGTTGA